MRKQLIFASLSALLMGTAIAQKSGDFVFKRDIDMITDDDISFFYTAALNSEESSFSSPRMFIGCQQKKPYIYINAKTIVGNYSTKKVDVRVRFDQGTPSGTLVWNRSPTDIYVAVIPDDARPAFIEQALKAQQVVIQVSKDDGTHAQLQFGLNKLDLMLSKLVCAKSFLK